MKQVSSIIKILLYNKNFFYKNGYEIKVIDDNTKEDLVKNNKVTLDKSKANYISITCVNNVMEDNTKVRIIFKAIEED